MRCPKCDSAGKWIKKNRRGYECLNCGFTGDRAEFQRRDGTLEALFDIRAERNPNPGKYVEVRR